MGADNFHRLWVNNGELKLLIRLRQLRKCSNVTVLVGTNPLVLYTYKNAELLETPASGSCAHNE
jgi:hypothetical protein